jgi:Ca-activated chloride channel family protein
MDPREAMGLAASMGVRVFTVLVGAPEGPAGDYETDPELLREIAATTGGLYFGAADDRALAASFERIRGELEKTELRVTGTTADRELAPRLVAPALVLLLLELGLALTRFRRFP